MKANLDQTYRWGNKYYGPGENVEIPQALADAAGIKKATAKSTSTNQNEPPPPGDPAGSDAGSNETK